MIEIRNLLETLIPDKSQASAWLKKQNKHPLFNGVAPLDYINQNGIDGMDAICRLLKGRLNVW